MVVKSVLETKKKISLFRKKFKKLAVKNISRQNNIKNFDKNRENIEKLSIENGKKTISSLDNIVHVKNIANTLLVHPFKRYRKRTVPPTVIVLHASDRDWTPSQVAEYDVGPNHISNSGCPGITYHRCITSSDVYQTQDDSQITWHAGKHNNKSLAVCMLYAVTNSPKEPDSNPSPSMLDLAIKCCARLAIEYGINSSDIQGHRELEDTGFFWDKGKKRLLKTCPGMGVNMAIFRYRVTEVMQEFLIKEGCYEGEVDGLWGPHSKVALFLYRAKQ